MIPNLAALLREHRWIILLSLVFLALGVLRLNDLSLYTDSTRYVIWGTSFAHARGFVDKTQPDPERYVVNAPLYSVLIAPVLLDMSRKIKKKKRNGNSPIPLCFARRVCTGTGW